MATDHLAIPDISASQNQKEVTANTAHNLLDRAMNGIVAKTITGDTSFTTTETRENALIELTGTPGAPHDIDMPDTNERVLVVFNNTDDVMTIRNSASGGSGQPVLSVGETVMFHYDGTDFLNLADPVEVGTWTPTITFSTPGDEDIVQSVTQGRYFRIGPVVWVGFSVVTSTFLHTTASGELRVTGLPFTSEGTHRWTGVITGRVAFRTGYHIVSPEILAGTAFMRFRLSTANMNTIDAAANASDTTSGTQIRLLGGNLMYGIA